MSANIYIGTEDYDHDSWNGGFYDERLPVEWRFQHYVNQLRSIFLSSVTTRSICHDQIEQLVQDVDPGFTFVISVDVPDLYRFRNEFYPNYWVKLSSQIVAFQLEISKQTSSDMLEKCLVDIEWLQTLGPLSIDADPELLDICKSKLAISGAKYSSTWRPELAGEPGAEGEFLLVVSERPELPDIRRIIDKCDIWTGANRSAGIYFSPGPNSAEIACQGRLLLEMMGH